MKFFSQRNAERIARVDAATERIRAAAWAATALGWQVSARSNDGFVVHVPGNGAPTQALINVSKAGMARVATRNVRKGESVLGALVERAGRIAVTMINEREVA